MTAAPTAAAPTPALDPPAPAAEATTTIVIGSGFPGLAMAAELNRQRIKAVVVDSLPQAAHPPAPSTGGVSLDAVGERAEILRVLEHYALRHSLDIRPATCALDIRRGPSESGRRWEVQTATGTLTAHNIVFTRGALNQLRRMLHGMGLGTGPDLAAAMHSLGLYLVGVGGLDAPTTGEILHQAKRAGQSMAGRGRSG